MTDLSIKLSKCFGLTIVIYQMNSMPQKRERVSHDKSSQQIYPVGKCFVCFLVHIYKYTDFYMTR